MVRFLHRLAPSVVGALVLLVALPGCAPATHPTAAAEVPPSAAPPPAPPAASPPVVPAPPGTPAAGRSALVTVVLDPGHDGGNAAAPAAIGREVPDGRGGAKACNTTGTATDAGYPEHAFTWDLAGRVRTLLERQGVRVVLTRPSDTGVGPCVDRRAATGNAAGAAAVVSLHGDGAAPSGHGFHVATSSPPLDAAQGEPSRSLARALVAGLQGAGFVPSTYVGDHGLDPRADLAGLNASTVPAALVECANMRNPVEAAVVSSPAGRDRYARAVSDGVLRWLASR